MNTDGTDSRSYHTPVWRLGAISLPDRPRPLVMGIVNLTPDSFYPASRRTDAASAIITALRMVEDGADILDLGAESSRPGAVPVGSAEEQDRLLPVLEELHRQTDIPVTVDTWRATTAQYCLQAGADGINDITAGTADPDLFTVAAAAGCGLVLMHMCGNPRTMQNNPQYGDVVAEVTAYLAGRARAAEATGVAPDLISVDPGIGFGKNLDHNLALLANLHRVGGGRPLLVGASRKSFVGQLTATAVEERLPGSLAALSAAFRAGVTVVRVHDVSDSVQFLDTLAAITAARTG